MDAIGTGNDEGLRKLPRTVMKLRAIGVIALAALLLSGFATEASAQSGSSTIVVRARGTAGGESITLRVDNSNVATWTLTTSLPDLQRNDEPHRQRHRGVHQRWRQPRRAGGLHHRQRRNPPVGEPELQHRALREWQLRRRREQRMDALQRRHCIWPRLQFGQQHRRSCAWHGGQ